MKTRFSPRLTFKPFLAGVLAIALSALSFNAAAKNIELLNT